MFEQRNITRLSKLAAFVACLVISAPCLIVAADACCSLFAAEFSNTIGYVAEQEFKGRRVHVLGYQNVAANASHGGNALFLPIPASPATMSEKNVVSSASFPQLLNKMKTRALEPLVDPTLLSTALILVLIAVFLKQIHRFVAFLLNPLLFGLAILFVTSIPISLLMCLVMGLESPGGNPGVRVNNLANLEHQLNIGANSLEIGGIVSMLIFLVHCFAGPRFKLKIFGESFCKSRSQGLMAGLWALMLGLLVPGCLNWLTATSRDASLFDGPVVFNTGVYTVVLAADAAEIPAALVRVPESRRPNLNPEIFESYAKWYKGWTFALCCFNNKSALSADPLIWWYEPLYPELVFFPALDAHDGKPPRLNVDVKVDHCLVASSDKDEAMQDIVHMFQTPRRDLNVGVASANDPLVPFIPKRIMGLEYNKMMPQGDFLFKAADIRRGIMEPIRVLPPGASETNSIWTASSTLNR